MFKGLKSAPVAASSIALITIIGISGTSLASESSIRDSIETPVVSVAPAAQPTSSLPSSVSVPASSGAPAGMMPGAAILDASGPDTDGQILPGKPGSLAALVEATSTPATLDSETRCLATAVFYEAKSESLTGQLAVARVVINRAKSGRFASSLCGVVTQRGQFSFVHRGALPTVSPVSRDWREAVAIAQIAQADRWQSQAEGALFFHARYVQPGWKLRRVAQIENHIFYR